MLYFELKSSSGLETRERTLFIARLLVNGYMHGETFDARWVKRFSDLLPRGTVKAFVNYPSDGLLTIEVTRRKKVKKRNIIGLKKVKVVTEVIAKIVLKSDETPINGGIKRRKKK